MLTLQFIPYAEIEKLDSDKRISKILRSVKSDKIVLIEGRLKPKEEADLIQKTMEQINEKFKGIELSVVKSASLEESLFKKLKSKFINLILGDRYGFTIIGPAKIVKEIRQDPDKIQLLTDYSAPKTKR
ncbi:MAG: DUF2073 domain-containing protein [Candidatus Woesearchaeota archaeon]